MNAFKSADAGSDTDEDEDGGALLRKKEKTPAQLRAEQKEADEQAARTQKARQRQLFAPHSAPPLRFISTPFSLPWGEESRGVAYS